MSKRWFASLFVMVLTLGSATAQSGTELRFCLWSEPKTFNPLLVQDDSSETVRYLTGGVLVRLNRQTQQLEPELATAWKTSRDGRTITFALRQNVKFSDGTAFSAEDVAHTIQQMMDPNLHSPTGDSNSETPRSYLETTGGQNPVLPANRPVSAGPTGMA